MALRQETQQCFPKEMRWGITGLDGEEIVSPAPEPAHERCPGGHTVPGLIGGWLCPCPCHNEARKEGRVK